MSDRGATLLRLAREAIAAHLDGRTVGRPEGGAWLDEPRAVFVTLKRHGDLRGCIGQLEARFPLHRAVVEAAVAAAVRDTRFAPVTADELPGLRLEVSALSPLTQVPVQTEAEALKAIHPGVHGVVLSWGGHSGVFIPEMWKQLPDPKTFLFQLKRKAGLPADTWHSGTRVELFTAEIFHEEEPP